jgi:hypothetical protein
MTTLPTRDENNHAFERPTHGGKASQHRRTANEVELRVDLPDAG